MNAKCKIENVKWFAVLFLILHFTFLITTPVRAQGILPTPGETCTDETCRKQICPSSRICSQGKCIVPGGNVSQETLPCNFTLDEIVLTGIKMSNFIFGITGSLMLLFIAYGGYQLFTSMGNPEGIQAGRKTLTSAFIGVILIFAATILVRFAAGLILPHAGEPGATIPEGAGGSLPKIQLP